MFFRKMSEVEGRRAIDSLNQAQKLLDERFEKKQVDFNVYQKQCQEFGARRESLRKKLGEEVYHKLTLGKMDEE